MATPKPVKSFEQNLKELEKIVERLESGSVSLDEALSLYQKGRALGKACEARLKEVEMRVRKLVEDTEGNLSAQALDTGEGGDDQTPAGEEEEV